MVINSEHIEMKVKKDFSNYDEKNNHLNVTIAYSKPEKCYYLHLIPITVYANSIVMQPMYAKTMVLLHNIERRSKSKMKKAIELYNADLDEIIKILKSAFKTDFTKEELTIEVD